MSSFHAFSSGGGRRELLQSTPSPVCLLKTPVLFSSGAHSSPEVVWVFRDGGSMLPLSSSQEPKASAADYSRPFQQRLDRHGKPFGDRVSSAYLRPLGTRNKITPALDQSHPSRERQGIIFRSGSSKDCIPRVARNISWKKPPSNQSETNKRGASRSSGGRPPMTRRLRLECPKNHGELMELLDHRDLVRPVPDQNLYKAIWASKISPKLHLFLWNITQGDIALGENLARRGITNNITCRHCGEPETTDHFLLRLNNGLQPPAVESNNNLVPLDLLGNLDSKKLQEVEAPKTASHGWRGILAGRNLLVTNLSKAIGDGETTRIWKDPWLSTLSPARPIGPTKEEHQDLVVADLL
ncbi:hypothetical protein F2Q69_00045974 [Brassica cretica]|uniref:Reverse transcriptase zinc-binding domain-containing protein n=1 Tax=Brassica cretica TaxID=69181 RepID=A0A8S9PSU0_BRACR|nr:hypothetical protein F2Q69_00045974 [Brassica cretica]